MLRSYCYMLLALCLLSACNQEQSQVQSEPLLAQESSVGLVFDPESVDLGHVLEGEKLQTTVLIRNNAKDFMQIVKLESSCGCTTAEPESRLLAAGAFTVLHVEIDTVAKRGDIRKSISMTDQHGVKSVLWLNMHVQPNPHSMAGAASIFAGKCASCHYDPAQGKLSGVAIYKAVCIMCHGDNAKGAYAPNLRAKYDKPTLIQLISLGTRSHYMPAFAQENGGPLNKKQITALTKWIISLDD